MKWLFLLVGIAISAAASLLVKMATQPPRSLPSLNEPWSLVSNWHLLVGITLYGTAFILYTLALKFFPLNIAHPILTAGTIVCVAVLSVVVLGEVMLPRMMMGLAFLVIGVVLLAAHGE